MWPLLLLIWRLANRDFIMWTCLNPPRKTHVTVAQEEIATAVVVETIGVAEIAAGEEMIGVAEIAGAAEMIVEVLEMTLISKVIAWK
jgi:hypothetical protein